MKNIILILSLFTLPLVADYTSIKELPKQLKPFIDKGTTPIWFEKNDLNGDGTDDYVLVLERPYKETKDGDLPKDQRPLLIIINENGTLKVAKRSEKVVYCSKCGGMMGDPFMGVNTQNKRFVVSHYGGSRWKWSVQYTFGYSRRDKSWQLIEVKEENFDGFDEDNRNTTISIPPKDFGLIDIEAFDPEKWKGVGPK